jgi:predicted Fe-S protein YdhL (DUF1289 family)
MSTPQDPATVASPCNDICRLDAQQVCVGCGRTLQEIADWGSASAERRRQIVAAAQLRQAHRPALQ